ncbi:hypothetical protein LG291_25665 (plasmid) [Cytobacillus firmus]|uniref:hypothetical protein n=1 Tax=Bacillaceae TaxID=186817 RepID=UPI001A8CA9C6|nr:hypothetical protein [Bacillus sp. NTK034]MBN8202629.1 hypothetical protein [Bacillus sp. NTK034]
MIIKKVYRVFDNLFFCRKDAEAILSGWEHKENVYVQYAVLEESKAELIVGGVNYGIPAEEVTVYTNEKNALQDLTEDC